MYANDDELSRAVARGSDRAFEELIRRYGGLVNAIVKYHLQYIPMWREDCVNDVLFTVWQNIDRFDAGKNSLKNWIGAVAKYRAINYKRKYLRDIAVRELTEDIADGKDVDAEILEREIENDILSLLDGLNAADREIFIRRYIMEQPVSRIAADKNKNPSWVYNRLSRGRKILRMQKWSDYREK